ncbi:MAG TPA: glycoside hydrolase family 2 [Firmicutes bacterium]|nr:glycoside hydrolase family 2 [Bacillota bacterium]
MREEYPRPQFVREQYMTLNGAWDFAFDDQGLSLREQWFRPGKALDRTIEVPFVYECPLSGLGCPGERHDTVFYKRRFTLPPAWAGQRVLLHFGAVDYRARVYLNGVYLGGHEGGHAPFSFDITDSLTDGEQELSVWANDPLEDESIPRGKQYWKLQSRGIWYTRSTGIWQPVWLEPVPEVRVDSVRFTPEVDAGRVRVQARFAGDWRGTDFCLRLSLRGEELLRETVRVSGETVEITASLVQNQIFHTNAHDAGLLWSPEHPNLIDASLSLVREGETLDRVSSYFGMRKIHTENGMVMLNNRPYYMKLVLDQGYWPESLMTAPSDQAFRTDIELAKKMGFNGCRKHQKAEDPRFLYWADRLGYLVWGEMAAACVYSETAAARTAREWIELVERDYNHPSLCVWVPLNESWGVPDIARDPQQQAHSLAMYYLLKSLDTTRLVVSNDGWEMTRTDICAIHNYTHGTTAETEKYEHFCRSVGQREDILRDVPAGRPAYADGYAYRGEPILITECGGIAFDVSRPDGWGYTMAASPEDFREQYRRVIAAILRSPAVFGFCYTQLTDVEQEVNGLLNADRTPKCPPEEIWKINASYRPRGVY